MKKQIQFKICVILFITLPFSNLLFGQQQADRLDGSPFPVSSIPDSIFIVKDSHYNEAELLTINTLQGVLAKETPQIYRDYGTGYSIWLQDFSENYPVKIDTTFLSDFEGLIEHFKDSIAGYVLCNLHDSSSNTAISICGLLNAIAVTEEKVALMTNLGIELIEDVRSRDEQWAFDKYKDQFSKKIVTYQNEGKDLFLSDYSVYTGAFHFYDDVNNDLTTQAFSRMDNVGIMLGWGDDEYYTVSKASSNSLNVVPSDWAINISTLSNFQAETKQKNHLDTVITEDNVHTVCFVISDGDNVQWLLSEFGINQAWFGSPDRGKLDLGWTISPSLCELAPTVMKYFYDRSSDSENGRDYFIAGPSGIGYNYPAQFPAINEMSELLNEYMKKSDLNIVNVIDHPGNLDAVKPYLDQEAIDAIFLYSYADYYVGLNGSIQWYNNKPVIGGRLSFWDGVATAESLAYKLNKMPRDPKLASGYSLIPVHAWSVSVSEVKACVDRLNANVRVVAPDEFVKLIKANVEDESDLPQGINIAPESSVSVSSEYPDSNYAKAKVIDGIMGIHGSGEWASNGETTPWVKLTWPEERSITRIILYDRPNADDAIEGGTLTFSDGSSIDVGGLPNNGEALEIDFPEKKVSWVKFEVSAGRGFNVGLSEFMVIEAEISNKVQSVQKNNLSVYPNPTSDGVFYLDIPYHESFQLTVYNLNGVMMKRVGEYKSNDMVDIKNLPHGLYVLKISNANRVLVSRVLHKSEF